MRLLGPVSPPEVAQDFDPLHHEFLRPLDGRSLRRLAFHHQHVAVGQHVKRARVLQPGGERADFQPLRGRWRLILLPADNARDMHRRQEILMLFRQDGIGSHLGLGITAAIVASGKTKQRTAQQC